MADTISSLRQDHLLLHQRILEQRILEEVVAWFVETVPDEGVLCIPSAAPPLGTKLFMQLQQNYGLTIEESRRFFNAVYWHLVDHSKMLRVDTYYNHTFSFSEYSFGKMLPQEQSISLAAQVYADYEQYLMGKGHQ